MLRNMKAKALALLTALAMTLGLGAIAATPALAVTAGTGSLTVTGNDAFKSVDAYQMFVVQGDTEGSAKYVLNEAWNNFFTSTNLDEFPADVAEDDLSDAAFTYIKGLGESDSAGINAFAKKAAAWAAKNLSGSKINAAADEGTNQAVLSGLAYGYYLVVPNPKGSTPDTDHQNRGTDAMLVNVNKNAQTMQLKTVYPTVDKKVGEGDGQNHASASVGDTLDFTLTSTVPDISEYTQGYQFSFVDTLSEGLTFNEGSVKVMIGGQNVTSDCTIVNPSTGNNNALTIHFGTTQGNLQGDDAAGKYDATSLFSGKAGQTITVTYTATLNKNAVVADGTDDDTDADNDNTVKVVYSNNPSTNGTGDSGESKTHQYTFGFNLYKTDGTNGLANAQFQLKDSEGNVIDLISAGTDTYRPIETGETGVDKGIVTTPADGVIHFTGLAEGTYTLHEVKAPEGYNTAADTNVVIAAEYEQDGTLKSWSVKVDNQAQAGQTVEVVNHAGTLLPGTGGIGTVVFTVAGIVLIVAGVAWAMRRRQRD